MFVYLSDCLHLFASLSVCLFFCLFVCLPVCVCQKTRRKIISCKVVRMKVTET